MDLKKIYKWSDEGEYDKIINEIKKLPKEELSFNLNNQLARAYNNVSEYDQAIKTLLSQIYDGKGDAYWNYVLAYAFYFKNDKKQSLKHFEKSFELGNKNEAERWNVKYFIARCKIAVNGIDNSELRTIAEVYKDFGFNISCISKKANEYNSNARSFFKTPSHKSDDLFDYEQEPSELDSYDW